MKGGIKVAFAQIIRGKAKIMTIIIINAWREIKLRDGTIAWGKMKKGNDNTWSGIKRVLNYS